MLEPSTAYDTSTIINALNAKGKNHNYYYHYTSWDSAMKILQNHTFLLTRGNSLKINDQHEAKMKGASSVWNKTYIGSFSYGSSENMAMWGLYGLPWEDAVRLEIPKARMMDWINSIHQYKPWNGEHPIANSTSCPVTDVVLNDIVYVNGVSGDEASLSLTYNNKSWSIINKPELFHLDTASEMTGYIKNYAWRYENEVRIRICLPKEIGVERIQIGIPPETVESIKMTTGPNFTDKSDALYLSLKTENRIQPSAFSGLVRYKPLCDMCYYKHYKAKP